MRSQRHNLETHGQIAAVPAQSVASAAAITAVDFKDYCVDGNSNGPYEFQLDATSNTPSGVSLNTSTGVLTGNPTGADTYAVRVRALYPDGAVVMTFPLTVT